MRTAPLGKSAKMIFARGLRFAQGATPQLRAQPTLALYQTSHRTDSSRDSRLYYRQPFRPEQIWHTTMGATSSGGQLQDFAPRDTCRREWQAWLRTATLTGEMQRLTNTVQTAGTQTAPFLSSQRSERTARFRAGCSALYARVMVLSYFPAMLGIRLLR